MLIGKLLSVFTHNLVDHIHSNQSCRQQSYICIRSYNIKIDIVKNSTNRELSEGSKFII